MKRIALIVGVVALAAGGAWGALWYTGRSAVGHKLDEEVARLQAEGWTVEIGGRRIDGFPLGYRVVYEDVRIADPAGSLAWSLPTLTGTADARNPDRLRLEFPPSSTLELATGAGADDPQGLPSLVEVSVEAEALVVEALAGPGGALEAELSADSVLLVSDFEVRAVQPTEDRGAPPAPPAPEANGTAAQDRPTPGAADGARAPADAREAGQAASPPSGAAGSSTAPADEGEAAAAPGASDGDKPPRQTVALPVAAALELGALAGAVALPPPGAGPARGRLTLGQLDYAMSALDPEGVRTTIEGVNADLSVTASSDLRTRADWLALLSGENRGSASLAYQAGEATAQVRVQGGGDGMDGTFVQSAGTSGGVARIAEGLLEVRLSSETNAYRILPDDPDNPVRGTVGLKSFEAVYQAPTGVTDEAQPFAMRLALIGLEAEESLWRIVDPGSALDRGEAHLIAEVSGRGRLLERPQTGDGLASPAIQLETLDIVAAELKALGAGATAAGGVTFDPVLGTPSGKVTIETRNVLDVLGRLAGLGLIDEGTLQMATLLSTLYTRPGPAEDTLVSEIDFREDGIFVNGLQVR